MVHGSQVAKHTRNNSYYMQAVNIHVLCSSFVKQGPKGSWGAELEKKNKNKAEAVEHEKAKSSNDEIWNTLRSE